ncbi:MAG TPA: DUF5668 domain-containing protein [Thermoanaerobaculia bacterium]|jgi:hypothetical protein|nr:DUF5668 domain-containing protein [Thermoanaerobaculia bacterium]
MNAVEPFPPYDSPEAPAPAPQPGPPGVAVKRPGLAAVLSAFPGMGHIYNGLYLRGLVFFLIIASLLAIVVRGHGLVAFALAFFWLFNILDAYRQAALINYGYAQDLGLLDRPKSPVAGQVGVVAGVLLVLIGTFALLDRFVNINLDWLIDLWPVGLILAGAWLIVGAFRDRKRARGGLSGV